MSRRHTGESMCDTQHRCDLQTDRFVPGSDLLDAVLSFREIVKAALSDSDLKSLERGDEVYIGVLAAGGWECESTVYTRLSTE
jgi:hypothetical protein